MTEDKKYLVHLLEELKKNVVISCGFICITAQELFNTNKEIFLFNDLIK